jgi:hypothetical protein
VEEASGAQGGHRRPDARGRVVRSAYVGTHQRGARAGHQVLLAPSALGCRSWVPAAQDY